MLIIRRDYNQGMEEKQLTFKITIIGLYSAGLESFFWPISEISTVHTDGRGSGPPPPRDEDIIFGRISFDRNSVLYLLGIPPLIDGSPFDTRDISIFFKENSLGVITLIDGTRPETFAETLGMLTRIQYLYPPQPAYVM